jgi:O-antigen/teichoic acid export membrane protein
MNTAFLYGKMIVTMFISLFSTRLILGALGVEDFGIFNLVAGVIGMLTFLNGAMAVSTQRYLSFYLGAGNIAKQKSVFNASVLLHLIIGVLVILALEILGLFLFDGTLNIPLERIPTAKLVYHFMVISTFFTINSVPYDALINAHENMLLDTVVGIFESLLKLGIAIWLVYSPTDKLVLFGLLTAGLTILIRIIKSVYCTRKYEECSLQLKSLFNHELFKEMFSFAGWNLFGAFCNVVRDQGLAIVLNLFVGIIANAAYGIANQVNGQLSAFALNIIKALNPQIVKSEGSGDRKRMLKLAMIACKLSFFLLAFFAVPLIIEMHYVLSIWLKTVPEYAVLFCQLILIISLLKQLTWGLMVAIQSVGIIKLYQAIVGSLLILNLPVAILLMKLGFPAYTVLLASIFLEILAGAARIVFARKLTGLNSGEFLIKIIIIPISIILLVLLIAFVPHIFMEENFLRLLLSILLSSFFILLFGKLFAISVEENKKIAELISSFLLSARRRFTKTL